MKKAVLIIALIQSGLTLAQNTVNLGLNSGTGGRFGVYIGESAGNASISPDAYHNTFIGFNAGLSNISGYNNTFLGSLAGESFETGSRNIFIGSSAGRYTIGGFGNILIGNATAINLSGSTNTIIGISGGRNLTTGVSNTYVGYDTGYSNSTGSNNTALGRKASQKNQSGSRNVSVGEDAGYGNLNGSNNVVIGYKAGYLNTGGSNVFLGYGAGYNEIGSNKLYIENSSNYTPLIFGDFNTDVVGVNTTEIPSGYTFAVNGKTITEEVKVQLKDTWPDYVFKIDYDLPNLSEVEIYIQDNGHLKDIPSAREVEENGILLGEMDAKLLQKIEELTLYTIQQDNKLQKQDEQIAILLNKMETLEKTLKTIGTLPNE